MIINQTAGGIDTSDATASAANIDSGKTAYADGVKITGTSTKTALTFVTGTLTRAQIGGTLTISGLGFTPRGFALFAHDHDNNNYYNNSIFIVNELTYTLRMAYQSMETILPSTDYPTTYELTAGSLTITANWLRSGTNYYTIWGE